MTAEIAILNKTAVALAADSAVTISTGSDQQKIFDSADKLFELSYRDPIAIMINNDMSFLETPLPILIKEFRNIAPSFNHVRDAASVFLNYLDDFAKRSPEKIKSQNLQETIRVPLTNIGKFSRDRWIQTILDDNGELKEEYANKNKSISDVLNDILAEELEEFNKIVDLLEDASFVGGDDVHYSNEEIEAIKDSVNDILSNASDDQKLFAVDILKKALKKQGIERSSTGLIFAGYGKDEIFPTLISFELKGIVGNKLKFFETNFVDIDRNGVRARVLPFAQKEMVERFLHGLDTPLKYQISEFCKKSIPNISAELIGTLDLPEVDAELLRQKAHEAESAFFDGLHEEGFEAIRSTSEAEIEDMVEFMPKPEMARMAEALVNLTSIKRRVSRGFETVGGPIDVAIISKSEGFVWVSRKHYFPRELNERYFARIGSHRHSIEGDDHA